MVPQRPFRRRWGWEGLQILLPIDMVLGPTLTYMFYKPGKTNNTFDLGAIAAVQVLALSYGVYAVYSQHPKSLVLAEGALVSLTALDQSEALVKLAKESLEPKDPDTLSEQNPPLVVAKPYPKEEFGEYLVSVMNTELELAMRADRYQPAAQDEGAWAQATYSDEQVFEKLGTEANPQYDYLPVRSMHGMGVAVIEKDTRKLLRVEPSRPTPPAAALEQSESTD